MRRLVPDKECTGCAACYDACNVGAVEIKTNEYGFLRTQINDNLCISCNRCQKACHILNEINLQHEVREFYAAAMPKKELKEVSSGGVSYAVAKTFLLNGGIVYGAVQNGKSEVTHVRIDNLDELKRMRRSKYLPSNTIGIFKSLKLDLDQGKQVLFTGVPCQNAAIRSFLQRQYDNLYICEIICHGIPSKKVFDSYISETENYYNDKVISINFRDKSYGWNNNHIRIEMEKNEILCSSNLHPFHSGYLKGLYTMESCSNCKYATISRSSDVVVADFWKYDGKLLEDYKKEGISLVYCTSEKGKKLLMCASSNLQLELTTENKAILSCKHLTQSPSILNENIRNDFWLLYNKYGFFVSRYLCMRNSFSKKICKKLLRSKYVGNATEKILRKFFIYWQGSVYIRLAGRYRNQLHTIYKTFLERLR